MKDNSSLVLSLCRGLHCALTCETVTCNFKIDSSIERVHIGSKSVRSPKNCIIYTLRKTVFVEILKYLYHIFST